MNNAIWTPVKVTQTKEKSKRYQVKFQIISNCTPEEKGTTATFNVLVKQNTPGYYGKEDYETPETAAIQQAAAKFRTGGGFHRESEFGHGRMTKASRYGGTDLYEYVRADVSEGW